MLPFRQRIAFLIFALITGLLGLYGFYRVYRRIAVGRADTDERFDRLPRRIWYALVTTLMQTRTFRKRPWVSFFHSFIFYGFTFYLLVNLVDALEGFVPISVTSLGLAGQLYVFAADIFSALVLVGVVALVFRRFATPARRDFRFNERTILHKDVQQQYITSDSLIVSVFILFHVGSRAIGSGAKLVVEGPDSWSPFATLLSHLFTPQNAENWRIFGYWGALGSVLAFLVYFPYSKHIHIFMAPAKYASARTVTSGVLPAVVLDMEADEPKLGAEKLEDLAWPRLLDAYACIQCNRCQDVCPATATGKALSPSALEINKRMELNDLGRHQPGFEIGAASPRPLLQFALSPEAAWACTTCGACMQACPVQDEPMLDIIDIRRNQVMIHGEFPPQLQTAFRGMERAKNPWGINHDKRLEWANGLNVKTTDENPAPDVLFWVGCAASYDPQSQKTARAFVQLLDHAGVDFAVLGKRECCTGDSARRAGNEYLYRQLADQNVTTLNEIKPKLIVATCPHCLNTVGKEYAQLGGDYKVMHHTEYLETLVAGGRLKAEAGSATVTYHDPCYLGRHNGVYDAPRNLLNIISNSVVELDRNRENSFCCGAGGAQFWKEEEAGVERISDNRYREAQQRLQGADEKVLAVGCPFCKSMLESTPGKGADAIAVKDVAELLLEGLHRSFSVPPAVVKASPEYRPPLAVETEPTPLPRSIMQAQASVLEPQAPLAEASTEKPTQRKKWAPKTAAPAQTQQPAPVTTENAPVVFVPLQEANPEAAAPVVRKAWTPKSSVKSISTLGVSPEEKPKAE
jgi:Fe-S oxidoreductase